jgi:hypothetical protein
MSDRTQLRPGYPIRKPWDHSSVDNSPRHIAASHVLHRPLVPRHPHNCPKTLDHKTRCSQPLYKSQQTTNHHHEPTHPKQPRDTRQAASSNQKPKKPNPNNPQNRGRVGVCFLRTPTGCPQTTINVVVCPGSALVHATPAQTLMCSLERR